MAILIELYAGLCAVGLRALGAKPIVSRIGTKTGYAEAILKRLGNPKVEQVLAFDSDPSIVQHLNMLASAVDRRWTAQRIEEWVTPARKLWEHARDYRHGSSVYWLLWTAGARGGIGGFKGAHKLRPHVNGFIPSRAGLVERLREFGLDGPLRAEVRDALQVRPGTVGLTSHDIVVYLDPPYPGRQSYGQDPPTPDAVGGLARAWADAGARVGLSWGEPTQLPGFSCYNITDERKGQKRRSLTKDAREFLLVSDQPRR